MSREPQKRLPSSENWDDAARHHLDLIQATIIRMSAASSSAKGWVLPVVTGAYGYALTQHAATVSVLGVGAAVSFWVLDTRYLREERAYRALFRATVEAPEGRYDMNAARFYLKPTEEAVDCRLPSCRLWKAGLSWSTGGFYLPVIALGILLTIAAR